MEKTTGFGAQQVIQINSMLQSEQGQVFLKWLKLVCEVETSLEKEEEFDTRRNASAPPTPLCPLRLAKKAGLRSAYYKVVAADRAGAALLAQQLAGKDED